MKHHEIYCSFNCGLVLVRSFFLQHVVMKRKKENFVGKNLDALSPKSNWPVVNPVSLLQKDMMGEPDFCRDILETRIKGILREHLKISRDIPFFQVSGSHVDVMNW